MRNAATGLCTSAHASPVNLSHFLFTHVPEGEVTEGFRANSKP